MKPLDKDTIISIFDAEADKCDTEANKLIKELERAPHSIETIVRIREAHARKHGVRLAEIGILRAIAAAAQEGK